MAGRTDDNAPLEPKARISCMLANEDSIYTERARLGLWSDLLEKKLLDMAESKATVDKEELRRLKIEKGKVDTLLDYLCDPELRRELPCYIYTEQSGVTKTVSMKVMSAKEKQRLDALLRKHGVIRD